MGEQFYNFELHPDLQPFCGLDVTQYTQGSPGTVKWLRWDRCVMGLKSSPHRFVKMQSLREEVVRGNSQAGSNPFHFDEVILNLPGSPTYNPCHARVWKISSYTGRTAGDMHTYVDDARVAGRDFWYCWAVGHHVSTRFCYLGIQDTLRKRSLPSQIAGAWTGSLAQSPPAGITVSCTPEKWTRAKEYVSSMLATVMAGQPLVHKDLERQRGFLVYVTRTYPAFVPYLKGIHLTLDSWRGGRDADGWKLQGELGCHFSAEEVTPTAPATVQPVPRLLDDLQALSHLMAADSLPTRLIRSSSVMVALYGFGDGLFQLSGII